jgi:hypothetical protein
MNFQNKLLLILFFSSLRIFGSETVPDTLSINYLRTEFYAAVEDEDKTYFLEQYIIKKYSEDYTNYNPIILAYFGGVQALKAKHAFNPVSKLSHLISGLNRLEEAISKSPGNLEIRFMRFSILDHVPGVLGYSTERESDKDKICLLLLRKDYSTLSYQIQKGIAEYMIASDRLTIQQKTEILDLLSSFANK